jgi:aarF domain-containing kinase
MARGSQDQQDIEKFYSCRGFPALEDEDVQQASRIQGIIRGLGFLGSAAWIGAQWRLTSRSTPEKEINQHAAEQALELVKSMKGYYIKAAQTLCGAGQFPEEFDEKFAELLDNCPKEPYEVIKPIVERELGCDIGAVFSEFEEEAVAAASIGQVHFARLHDGLRVAVKVQYPEVERFFKTDIEAFSLAMQLAGMGSKVKEVFNAMQEQFEQEFDYTKEAAVLREVAENIMPRYGDAVMIPLPVDDSHPRCPKVGYRTLCTRKVLTMERAFGKSIREHARPLLEMLAEKHKMPIEDLQKLLKQMDPSKIDPSKIDVDNPAVREAMNMKEVNECKSGLYIFAMKVRNLTARLVGGCAGGCHCTPPAWTARKAFVPLNGPRIAKLLYEVHGHELFHNGLVNSDPHAGNVLMLEDGRLGLIDYGAVLRLDAKLRTDIARLIVAIADEDDDEVAPLMHKCGFRSENHNPKLALLMAHMFFNRGPWPADMKRLVNRPGHEIGDPVDRKLLAEGDVMTLDKYTRGGKLDNILEFPGHMVMLQRCCMVLSGIGMELGAGRLSSAGMFKAQAKRWLAARPGRAGAEAGRSCCCPWRTDGRVSPDGRRVVRSFETFSMASGAFSTV